MLAAVKGYYDGNQIVLDEDDKKSLHMGDEVIITILDGMSGLTRKETRVEKRRKTIDLDKYVIPSGRTTEEIDKYIKELRNDERV